ncbi:unnamed protein product [Penicillium roqueforti FM164]|uniref:Genomic scaffold, ProqFM164S03 n=1 Tax=Penicillium roqueforti (strain FM164) TaxID=1365484 RepID=W6QCY6_PENRF|nr:unnamed protein product [Penicillium roqueforti FM164]
MTSVVFIILHTTKPHSPSIFHLPLYEVCFLSVLSPILHLPSSHSMTWLAPDDTGLTVLDTTSTESHPALP